MDIGIELALDKKIDLLLIEDNIHDARIFAESLNQNYNDEFQIIHTSNLKAGIEHILQNPFDIIVADLNLPDSSGLNTFFEIKKKSGDAPIIILSGINDNSLTLESVKGGAQDYIYKGQYEGDFLYRVIRHAIERKKLFKEINEKTIELTNLNNELKELNYNKDRMYSILSHDLISPINSLLGYADLFKNHFYDLSDEEKLQIVSGIDELSKKSIELMKDFLTWSAANMGRFEYKPEKLNVAQLLKKQIDFSKPSADKKNIIFIEEIKSMDLLADKIMIETVIRNLISNAIKFSNPSGKIFIKNYFSDGMVNFIIEDTGVGMDDSVLSKLFKISENVSTPGTNQEKGIGLGLLVCKEFIDRHNGTLKVLSKKNVGTTFSFSIPSS